MKQELIVATFSRITIDGSKETGFWSAQRAYTYAYKRSNLQLKFSKYVAFRYKE